MEKIDYDKFARILNSRDVLQYPYAVNYTGDLSLPLEEWLGTHCKGRHKIFVGRTKCMISFELENDFVLFQLTYG